jgi:RNA polymerase sigma factor (sigma-70 family)
LLSYESREMSEPNGFCELVRQAKAGRSEARADLLDQFRLCVVQICRETGGRDGAELTTDDLVQEVWLRVLEKLEQFHGSEDNQQTAAMFYNWVRMTARSVVFNLREARDAQCRTPPGLLVRLDAANGNGSTLDHRPNNSPASNDKTPSAIFVAQERVERVNQAIDSLPDELDRTIIRGRFFQGESLRQISERLEITYDKVRERFHISLRRLESELSDFS